MEGIKARNFGYVYIDNFKNINKDSNNMPIEK